MSSALMAKCRTLVWTTGRGLGIARFQGEGDANGRHHTSISRSPACAILPRYVAIAPRLRAADARRIRDRLNPLDVAIVDQRLGQVALRIARGTHRLDEHRAMGS